ncbi:MAG: PEGA domain-containing protein [Bryobacterales bacterium]|nr:PEGA domain-containing protein [Bryobacterales bacterium]
MKNVNLKFGRFGIILALALVIGLPLAAQDEAKIRVQADPSTAGLFIDGKYMGSAENFHISIAYAVSPGEHTIKLVDPRYEDYETKVTAEAGETKKFDFKMTAKPVPQPPFGQIRTIQGASKYTGVYLNAQYVGHVDEFSNRFQRLLLPPGSYLARFENPETGATYEESITVSANQTTTINLVGKGV